MLKRSILLAAAGAAAALDLPSIYGSHQVFQKGMPFSIWGTTTVGTSVSVDFMSSKYPASVNGGNWNLTIPAPAAGTTPQTITISSSDGESIVLQDVAFGEVYACSGQSNMQLSVLATVNQSATASASVQYSQYLRIFQVALEAAYANTTEPQSNLTASIPWSQVNPDNVLGMSAMCYFFGVQLLTAYPGTYIGMIDSSWGGTAIEVWMSGNALTACGEKPATNGPFTQRTSSLRVHAQTQDSATGSGSGSGIRSKHAVDDARAAAYTGAHKLRPSLPLTEAVQALSAVYPSIPSCLYNSMIVPLLPLAVKGWLWYQGEANTDNPTGYARCFPQMITQWRSDWHSSTGGATDPQAPFIFAQLAAWPNGDNGMIAVQRYAQQAALALPKVGMAVTADVSDPSGSFHPIHPPFKAEVARRAWLWADNVIYGNTASPTSGPRVVSVTLDPYNVSWGFYHYGIQGGVCSDGQFFCYGIRVTFDQPLVQRPLYGPWTGQYNGFELINTFANYTQPATLYGVRTDDPHTLQLNVTWVGPGHPNLIQYGWHDYPTMPLANAQDLPVVPFNATIALPVPPAHEDGSEEAAADAHAADGSRQYPAWYGTIGRE